MLRHTVRTAEAFGTSHAPGSINIGFGTKVGYWAGWVLPPDVPLILVANDATAAADATTQLLRVGLDRVEGVLAGGFEGWLRAGLPAGSVEQVSASELRDAVDRRRTDAAG